MMALAQPAHAQDESAAELGPPNPVLSFSLSQGLQVDQNRGLDAGADEIETRLVTGLAFAIASRTPISELALSGRTNLGVEIGSGSDDAESLLDGAQLGLSYDRAVPTGSLAVDATVRRDEVGFLRDLSDFIDEGGSIDLPDDFDDLEGEGTRLASSFDATLTLRDAARFGITLSAGLGDVRYDDVSSDDLSDLRRIDLGLGFRFDLTEVARLNSTFRASQEDEDGVEEVRFGADMTGSIERPDGSITGRLAVDEADEGVRTALSFGRSLERPLGTYAGSIGLSHSASGELSFNGTLSIARDLPRGALSLSLQQATGSADDGEELETSLSAGWTRELTPRSSLSLETLFGRTENLETDDRVQVAEVGVTFDQSVTQDWSLVLDYRYRQRDESGEDRASGQSLSLSLSRNWDLGL
jgi:hypothetical protein